MAGCGTVGPLLPTVTEQLLRDSVRHFGSLSKKIKVFIHRLGPPASAKCVIIEGIVALI